MDTTFDLLDTINRLDAANEFSELSQFVRIESHNPNDLLYSVYQLLTKQRFHSAYIVALFCLEKGVQGSFLSIALCMGGLIFQKPVHVTSGLAALTYQTDVMMETQPDVYNHVYEKIIDPAMLYLVGSALAQPDSVDILKVLELLKSLTPLFRPLFDWDAPIPDVSLEDMRRRARERQSLLVQHPLPPAGTPSPRRVLVVLRALMFPNKTWSRPFDVGPRLASAMNIYGWQAEHFPLRDGGFVGMAGEIVETCQQREIELLVLDDDIMMGSMPLRASLITRLRQTCPSIKIVSCILDAWVAKPDLLKEGTALVDGVWTVDAPSLPVWADPSIAHKVIQLPFPLLPENFSPPADRPLKESPAFFGSVLGFNWHRAFWVAAFEHVKLPIQVNVATQKADGLSGLESYAAYRHRLAEATCCVNLTMRASLRCVVTFRSFETVHSGSLLLQETASDMSYFLLAGEHYLEFSTLPELIALVRFVRENREEAEEVRRRGNDFVREQYNDKKIIAHLDKLVFF